MPKNTVWLEVDKTNQAILSYFLEQPTMPFDKVDYVQATKDELTYLSALEDAIFAPGTVATLSDLEAHRARVQAAKKTPEKAVATTSKTSSTNPATAKDKAKNSLINDIKKFKTRK
jgi:hypothetical protein